MLDLDDAMINGISHLAGGGKDARQRLVGWGHRVSGMMDHRINQIK